MSDNKENIPAIYRIEWESELLGVPLSEHPIQRISPILQRRFGTLPADELKYTAPNQEVKVVGIVADLRHLRTKKNQPMMFVKMFDATGELRVTVFPKTLSFTSSVFIKNALVLVTGNVSHRTEQRKKPAETAPPGGMSADGEEGESQPEEEEISMSISYEVIVNRAELVTL